MIHAHPILVAQKELPSAFVGQRVAMPAYARTGTVVLGVKQKYIRVITTNLASAKRLASSTQQNLNGSLVAVRWAGWEASADTGHN